MPGKPSKLRSKPRAKPRATTPTAATAGSLEARRDEAMIHTFHELRSGIVAMGAVLDIAAERVERASDPVESAKLRHELGILRQTSQRLDTLLVRARPLVRPSHETIATIDPRVVLDRALAATRPAAIERELTLAVRTSSPGLVAIDVAQLEGLYRELLGLAVEAAAPRQRIGLALASRGRSLTVAIARSAWPSAQVSASLAWTVAQAIGQRIDARVRVLPAPGSGLHFAVALQRRPRVQP